MAVELSDSDTVGTALTMQMALGFSVTVVGIFTIPLVEVCSFFFRLLRLFEQFSSNADPKWIVSLGVLVVVSP